MSSLDQISGKNINSDGLNTIKFKDVEVYFDSMTLPRAFEPMSSPSNKVHPAGLNKKE
jgi:hypothetical protein